MLGYFYFYFYFFEKINKYIKNIVSRYRTHVPTCEKVTRLPLSYRGEQNPLYGCNECFVRYPLLWQSCTNVQVLLMYVRGVIVRAHSALPSVCMGFTILLYVVRTQKSSPACEAPYNKIVHPIRSPNAGIGELEWVVDVERYTNKICRGSLASSFLEALVRCEADGDRGEHRV